MHAQASLFPPYYELPDLILFTTHEHFEDCQSIIYDEDHRDPEWDAYYDDMRRVMKNRR